MTQFATIPEWVETPNALPHIPAYFREHPNTEISFTQREILDAFPDAITHAKRNIKILKDRLFQIEKHTANLVDIFLEIIYSNNETVGEERESNIRHVVWYFNDRIVNPIKKQIRFLESIIRCKEAPFDTRDALMQSQVTNAKEKRIENYFKVNQAGFMSCPFHNEKTASCKVYKDNRYHCFGCGADGDIIDLVMKDQGLEFRQAIKYLNG